MIICGTANAIEFSGQGKTGMNNYGVNLKITASGESELNKFDLEGTIAWDRGVVVEFEGKGTLDSEKKLTFTFKDSFGNTGTGMLYAVVETEETKGKNPHFMTMNATTVIEPKAARQLFDYLLTEIK